MACTKHCIVLVSIIYLLSVKVSIGAHLSQVHRREVQSTKQEKPKPTEASTVSGVPSVRPIIENTDRECTRFEHSYCNSQYGYQHGLFPNHKGQTAEQAAAELDHFAQLFNSGCSDKIGVFLCFTYFPLCIPPTKDGTQLIGGAQLEEVLPCKETCEEVHKSECTEYVLNATRGTGWADHLSCNQDIFKPKSSKQCATGESDSDDEDSTDSVDSKSEICPTVRCQSRCVARKNCNRGTFKNTKNQYKFAAKVTVEERLEDSHSCKHAYNVSVEEQFNLLSHQADTNELTEAPALQNYSIILTSPTTCEECPVLTAGSTYLIAGQYHVGEDGAVAWELPNGKAQSLASKWVGRAGDDYDEKLQEWIDAANNVRKQET